MKTKQLLLTLLICAVTGSKALASSTTYTNYCPASEWTAFAVQVFAGATPDPNGEDLNTVLGNAIGNLDGCSVYLPHYVGGVFVDYTIFNIDSGSSTGPGDLGWDDENFNPTSPPRMKLGDGALLYNNSGMSLNLDFHGNFLTVEPAPRSVTSPLTWYLRGRQIPSPAISFNKIVPTTESGFAMYIPTTILGYVWGPNIANPPNFPPTLLDPTLNHIFERPNTTSWSPFQPTPSVLGIGIGKPVWIGPAPGSGGFSPAKIYGLVWDDNNGDTTKQPIEPGLPNQQVYLTGTISSTTFTAQDGTYSFVVPPGNYTVSTVLPSCLVYTKPPTPFTYTETSVLQGQPRPGRDFGAKPGVATCAGADLFVRVYATYQFLLGHQYTAPCNNGMIMHYRIFCRNNCGHTVIGATLNFVKPPLVTFGTWTASSLVITLSSSSSGSTRIWNLPTLPVGTAAEIDQPVIVPSGVVLNSFLNATATILPVSTDCFPADNTITHSAQVTCSFDPNDKMVTPKGCGPEGFIPGNQTLTYDVQFQNVGSGPAFDVVVHDQLDNNLDASTLELLGASHNYVFSMNGRDMVWTFPSIYLPDQADDDSGSHGFLSYRVRPLPGLAAGSRMTNQAAVYFDQNAPVLTAITTNTITSSPVPVAAFTLTPHVGSTGHTNDFTYTGGSTGATYSWDFGPNATPATSTAQNPAGVVFASDGDNMVSLQVSLGDCPSDPAVHIVTAGVPSLNAQVIDGQLLLSWQGNGYHLQERADLQPGTAWSATSATVTQIDSDYATTLPLNSNAKYYRLSQVAP
jgi:hypothetical protein